MYLEGFLQIYEKYDQSNNAIDRKVDDVIIHHYHLQPKLCNDFQRFTNATYVLTCFMEETTYLTADHPFNQF